MPVAVTTIDSTHPRRLKHEIALHAGKLSGIKARCLELAKALCRHEQKEASGLSGFNFKAAVRTRRPRIQRLLRCAAGSRWRPSPCAPEASVTTPWIDAAHADAAAHADEQKSARKRRRCTRKTLRRSHRSVLRSPRNASGLMRQGPVSWLAPWSATFPELRAARPGTPVVCSHPSAHAVGTRLASCSR